MATQIISIGSVPQQAMGSQYGLIINPDGTINIGSLSQTINIGSILNPIQIGSIVINDFLTVIQSGVNWGVSGTQFSNILGSVGITTNPLPVSGTNLLVTQSGGNWGVSGTAFTNVWTGVGSVNVSGALIGSVAITTSPIPISGGTFLFNRTSVAGFRQTANSGVGTQLTSLALPNGFTAVIKALNTNTTQIGLGSATTYNVGSFFNLYPNDSARFGIDNTNRLFFITQTNGDGIEVISET